MYRAGMAAILSQLVRDERLFVVEELSVKHLLNKGVCGTSKKHGFGTSIVCNQTVRRKRLSMSSRNLPNVLVLEAQQIDPYSLLRYKSGHH